VHCRVEGLRKLWQPFVVKHASLDSLTAFTLLVTYCAHIGFLVLETMLFCAVGFTVGVGTRLSIAGLILGCGESHHKCMRECEKAHAGAAKDT
jgi:hypothetical protein